MISSKDRKREAKRLMKKTVGPLEPVELSPCGPACGVLWGGTANYRPLPDYRKD